MPHSDPDRGVDPPEVTLREVARLADVSHGTVSNVLNRPERVAPATRDRVEAAMRRLSYVPNGAARQLAAGRSRAVGLVVLDLQNPFFLELARGVQDVVDGKGNVLMLFNSSTSTRRESQAMRSLQEQRASGAIISPVGEPRTSVEALRASGTRVVVLDRSTPEAEGCSVAVDDVLGGSEAVGYLLAQGHTRLAFVGGPRSIRQHQERLRGARAALRETSTKTRLDVLRTDMTVAGGERAAEELLSPDRRPSAVFCANDLIALGLERALLRAGVSVPDDVAIVGYDDVSMAAHAAVPITTVSQPMYEMGERAAQLLFDEIDNPSHQHQRVLYLPTLVVRGSA